jgi:hypothetical protein
MTESETPPSSATRMGHLISVSVQHKTGGVQVAGMLQIVILLVPFPLRLHIRHSLEIDLPLEFL